MVTEAATVAEAVADLLGQPLLLHSELDVDVYRLRRRQPGPDLVARVFGPSVERSTVDAAGRVLSALAGTRFPAERCPTDTPVAPIGDGGTVLVTEYVEPSPAPHSGFVVAWCAALLGRRASRSADDLPGGGGWHR
ncbi:MAG: hypothetical protein JWO63_388, partial [Frankiales bacterium]|nr:hypothetical protein [Frankiales bacterium]